MAFDHQLAMGLDKDGVHMRALSPATLRHRRSAVGPADKFAPPLTPAHELSRTRSLLGARIEGSSIRVYWRFDHISGKRWGRILDYHRQGSTRLPVRNVFGLSPESRRHVLQEAHFWWLGFSRGLPVRSPRRRTTGAPARPSVAVQPAYQPKPQNALLHGSQPSKVTNLTIGRDVYSMSSGSAGELFNAIKQGRFSGFRSYE
jgi:hypothetical protein